MIQLNKMTSKGATASLWRIYTVYYDSNVTLVDIAGYFDQASYEADIVLDSFRILTLPMLQDPLKDISNVFIMNEYLELNPSKTVFEGVMYILEKYIKENVEGWQDSVIT